MGTFYTELITRCLPIPQKTSTDINYCKIQGDNVQNDKLALKFKNEKKNVGAFTLRFIRASTTACKLRQLIHRLIDAYFSLPDGGGGEEGGGGVPGTIVPFNGGKPANDTRHNERHMVFLRTVFSLIFQI
jgi:hypothetical protein